MSVLKRVPIWLVIVSLGIVIAILLKVLKPSPQPKPQQAALLPVAQVVAAQPQSLSLPVITQGTLAPRREIDLVAEVAGKVVEAAPNFVSGAFFDAGERLVRVDDANYQMAKIRAEAKVADANQLLATEKGRAQQAKREWRDLGNDDANQLFLRQPQLLAAEATLAAAKADLAQSTLDVARTQISAPFAGRIRETYVNLGQYITPGSKIARVFDNQVIEVRLPLTDSQAALLDLTLGFQAKKEQGPQVLLTGVVAGQSVHWRGRIARTEASLDTKTRMYHAIAEIHLAEQPAGAIAPVVGLFVDAQIEGKLIDKVIRLPRSALYKQNLLYVLGEKNQIEIMSARVLAKTNTEVWLQASMEAGTRVVVERQGYLKPGVIVEPRMSEEK
jgi:RND family efflux transporter MFP subunit